MDTAPARLAELACYPALRLLVAANPSTPPRTLAELARDAKNTAIRRAVVQNPNASIEIFQHLVGEFPHEFLANPIIPLLEMTQPKFLHRLFFEDWSSLLRFEQLPLTWLAQLKTIKHYSREEQAAMQELMQLHISRMGEFPATWRAEAGRKLKAYPSSSLPRYHVPSPLGELAPADEEKIFLLFVLLFPQIVLMARAQWAEFARVSPHRIGLALSFSKTIGGETLARLSRVENSFLLRQVAHHPRASAKILAKLARHQLPEVRRAVAGNPHVPLQSVYRLLSESNCAVRRAAVPHPGLTREDHQILALDEDASVRAALVAVPQLAVDLLRQLAADPVPVVRAAVARNLRAPLEILANLAHDQDPLVRAAAAHNPRLPHDVLITLLTDSIASVRASLSGNASLPEPCYTQLARDPTVAVRRYLAANPRTPVSLLEQFWRTGDIEVWQGVARHPRASPEMLVQLAQAGNVRVRAAVAAHKRTPPSVLRDLAEENRREIWEGLTGNPHTPLDILERALTQSQDSSELWYRLFNHPAMQRERQRPFLALLVGKLQPLLATRRLPEWVRLVVRQYYTSLPPALLELFANSPYWEERYLAARHSQMAEVVLERLAHDGISYVRAAAQDTLRQPISMD